MSRPETCRIAATPADYQRYGIAKGEIAAWEDGFRTGPGGPGTFEWWYFDAVLDDGSTLVINFMVKDIRGSRGIRQPARPVVTFELDRPDGTHVERALHAQDDFAFAADRCDVRVGASTFAGDLHTYSIHVEVDAVTADVTLTGQVPSWRPETGHILFGDDQPHLFAWLPSVPQGAVQATLTVDGETRTLSGTGYHDHNWGDAAMQQLIHHWYWARAQAGGYCVIASDITAERKYGHTQVPIFMLAKDGKILAEFGDRACELGVEPVDGMDDVAAAWRMPELVTPAPLCSRLRSVSASMENSARPSAQGCGARRARNSRAAGTTCSANRRDCRSPVAGGPEYERVHL